MILVSTARSGSHGRPYFLHTHHLDGRGSTTATARQIDTNSLSSYFTGGPRRGEGHSKCCSTSVKC